MPDDRDRFGRGRESGVPRYDTPIQSGGPGGEFGGSQRLYTGRNPFITPNDPGMDFGGIPRRPGGRRSEGGRESIPSYPKIPWPIPERPEKWGPRRPWGGPSGPEQWGGPIGPRPDVPRPIPMSGNIDGVGDPFEYTQRSDGIEDMSYMSPNPFPYPGQPWPPVGRPPWGGPGEIDIAGQPGGGEGEFDIADVGDQYRRWNSIRRKYGAEVADRMMGGNVAVNRGGIMGLI